MNNEVKELIQPYNPNIKNDVWYITSDTRDARDVKKPYILARLEELEAENKQLQQKIDQLELNIAEVIKMIRDQNIEVLKYYDEPGETGSYEIVTIELLSLLERNK